MIPPVLATRECVQVQVDAETILARPLDSLQKVSTYTERNSVSRIPNNEEGKRKHERPGSLRQERFITPNLDRPIWQRNTDEIQSRASYLSKILLSLYENE